MLYYSYMQTVQEIEKIIVPILRKHGVTKASLFGSVVTGKMHAGSDVDILVELPKSSSLFDMFSIQYELEDVLHKPIDLVEYVGIKKAYREEIIKQQFQLMA